MVKEKSKALQCDKYSISYHAHQKCGQEIQYAYKYISAFEQEEEHSGNMIQWLCQSCRIIVKELESEMKKVGEIQRELQTRQEGNEANIVVLQNELKRMRLDMTQVEENRTLKQELEERKKEVEEKKEDHELADKTSKEEAKKKPNEIDKLKNEVSKHI